MTLILPLWGWASVAAATIVSLVGAYGCGFANGVSAGEDWMKRVAIRLGFARACDLDGGWRWYSREEIVAAVTKQNQ